MNVSNETMMGVQKRVGHQALVIGGSIAGLLAARVLADYFDTVTIVDRDVFPLTPDHRKGVPQSHHAHGLLATAYPILMRLFPDLMKDLRADGATVSKAKTPLAIVSPAGKLRLPPSSREGISFSRYLLEWHIRNYVSQRPEVEMITNTEVTGLLATDDQARVTGVQLRERGKDGRTYTLHTDLVVDASGRHSESPKWLVGLGYEETPIESINSNLRYASRFYARPEHFPAEWQSVIVNRSPSHPAAGLILSVDHERWHVTLGGMDGQAPPTDEEGFLQWARKLSDPGIYEALRVAQPLTPIRAYSTPENHLRRFERLQRWPAGFIVTGDAVCAFNPIYGQGMTVSALDAMTLNRCLQELQHSPRPNFEHYFQQQLAETVADAWLLSTNQDQRTPGVILKGARPDPTLRLLHGYIDLVLYSAVVDSTIAEAYFSVIMLASDSRSLARPALVARVLAVASRRALRRLFKGKEEPDFVLSPAALATLRAMPAAEPVQVS